MENIKQEIYANLNISPYSIFIAKRGKKSQVLVGQIIDALLHHENGPEAIKSLNFSAQTFNRNIKKLFPNVVLRGGGQYWLIQQTSFKFCAKCNNYKSKTEFSIDNTRCDKLDNKCRNCKSIENNKWYEANKEQYHKHYIDNNREDYNFRTAKRRAAKLQAIPKWANLYSIREIYRICPKGYHVDHIIPLQGKNVCGLHVENNLQLLKAEDNLRKSNKFGDMVKR